MIKKETVFIIGSGASKPYGYPTGIELKDLIRNEGIKVIENIEIYSGGVNRKGLSMKVYDLIKLIDNSNPDDQIDWIMKRFEKKFPYLSELGRMLIIHFILTNECNNIDENGKLKCKPQEDWYQELFSLMTRSPFYNPSPELFKENRLSFLTFNYDRSLDFFLKTKIEKYYDFSSFETNAPQIYSYFKPLHIYGLVSDLLGDKYIPFGNYQNEFTILEKYKDNIRLIRNSENDLNFLSIKEIISETKQIYFLGFGFDSLNLRILGFPNILNEGHQIFGTAFKKKKGQIEEIKRIVSGNKIINKLEIIDCTCLELLQEYPLN